ncbi:MAG: D-glycero-beta-D-manno-heptose 1-phosphate adenylyltransferase [Bacteroidetes bacterium]|nr:MAG: D-glycero-beta-D-manno-heptose 1-phosphate adenylyltransferase [Bacteroidota bacterium]
MRSSQAIAAKIMTPEQLQRQLSVWRLQNKTIAFTNGVFDLVHEGHIFSLSQAAAEADVLVVALNSDDSVRRLKGPERPLNTAQARALVMAALLMVDAVIIFDEDTPLELVKQVQPQVMVKGGDYRPEQIAGAKEVIAAGGRVVINPLVEGISTTAIIAKMRQ